MIKYQKSLDKFGYTEYLDERGLSPKAQRAKAMHQQLQEVDNKIGNLLAELKVKLNRNSTTVISSPYFDQFEEIIANTIQMWQDVEAPFVEEILVRTATFKKILEFSMPLEQIPITTPKDIARKIREILPLLNNPDQIILHPRSSIKNLKENMIVSRFHSRAGSLFAELGFKGIQDVSLLNNADNIFEATLDDSFNIICKQGGFIKYSEDTYFNLMKSAKIMTPFIEEIVVPKEKRHKPIVLEFRNFEKEGWMYMIFNDFEVI